MSPIAQRKGLHHPIHAGLRRHLEGARAFHFQSLSICLIGGIGGFNSLFQVEMSVGGAVTIPDRGSWVVPVQGVPLRRPALRIRRPTFDNVTRIHPCHFLIVLRAADASTEGFRIAGPPDIPRVHSAQSRSTSDRE